MYVVRHEKSSAYFTGVTINIRLAEVYFNCTCHLFGPTWNMLHLYVLRDRTSLENVQKFALRMCSKQWDMGYNELLDMFEVPSLENCRLYHKFCHLFKIVHGFCYFPPDIIVPNLNPSHSTRSFSLHQPFSKTTALNSSFVPDSIWRWNYLPEDTICSPSLSTFKNSLYVLICV